MKLSMIGTVPDAAATAAMEAPSLVTVVIAAYNAAAYLRRAIVSAREQSYRNIEIIVVDDGSTDDTFRVALAEAELDARVRVLRLEQNQGVSRARNAALRQARGAWIAILDADDAFSKQRIERLIGFAEAEKLDLAADNLELRDFESGEVRGLAFPPQWLPVARDADLAFLLRYDMPGLAGSEIGFMQPVFRTAFLREHGLGYAPGYAAGEDFLLFAECLALGARLRFLAEAHYIYYRRAGSASASRAANLERRRVHQRVAKLLADREELAGLLRLRGVLIDFELFNWHARGARFHKASMLALRLPKLLLLQRFGAAVLRRAGIRLGAPSHWVRMQLRRALPQAAPGARG